jgi:hypothetical protein
MKTIIAIIFACSIIHTSQAQEVSIFAGVGTYAMNDLKALNKNFNSQSFIPMHTTNNFDPYYTFGLRYITPLSKNISGGMDVNGCSTGSRLSYSDYSGLMHIDQTIQSINISAVAAFMLVNNVKNTFAFDPQLGVSFSKLKIQSAIAIGSNSQSEEYQLQSVNLFGEPGFSYIGWITKSNTLGIGLRVGYNVTILKGKLYFRNDDNAFLQGGSKPAGADWSGLRTHLSLHYRLAK